MKKSSTDPTNMSRFLIGCAKCCLSCAEKFIKFFNKHAYVEVIMRGANYCSAARYALSLITSNVLRFSVLHGVASIMMAFVKLFIIIIVLVSSYFGLVNFSGFNADIKSKKQLINIGGPLFVRLEALNHDFLSKY